MQHDDDTLIKEDQHFLDLIENGGVQLSSRAIINGATEIIKDMKRVQQHSHDESLVVLILSRAYSNRAQCYYDEKKFQLALDDYILIAELNPNNKDVKYNIKLCEKKLRESNAQPKLFTNSPQTEVHTPKAQRIKPNGSDQKPESPQGGYLEIGRQGSAFYKHEKKQRPQSPAHHNDSQYLNQPGGKTGRSK